MVQQLAENFRHKKARREKTDDRGKRVSFLTIHSKKTTRRCARFWPSGFRELNCHHPRKFPIATPVAWDICNDIQGLTLAVDGGRALY